ncbi:hypothetical protein A176_001391 [Myxococcus hansupus]|uniref:DUF3592 domain-containing protein n=1 Tax=Pseudomyxococcus hansupus TaxID=1297742 RepID=A0A0H4WNX1_9BACT|nr:DUF3592 domain-containing protein [Myxococcus hansupus]AKQ64479.1 hypothetical protein A176_001391 [Myxococcus hansupus]
MKPRESPAALLIVGALAAALGLSMTLGMMKPRPNQEADAPHATEAGKGSPRPWNIPHIPLAILALGLLGTGVGMVWHGFRNLRTNRSLLSEGVAVVGRVVRIQHKKQRRDGGIFITYQFADEHGTTHKGLHKVSAFGDALLHAEVGQDVTVLYDAREPTTHMLDVNDVRPVDAPRRRRPEAS